MLDCVALALAVAGRVAAPKVPMLEALGEALGRRVAEMEREMVPLAVALAVGVALPYLP